MKSILRSVLKSTLGSNFKSAALSVLVLFFSVGAFGAPITIENSIPNDGWQFNAFAGDYKVLASHGSCGTLFSRIEIFRSTQASTPAIEFKTAFQTDRSYSIPLRTESYATCSSDYGQPCGGSAPDIWIYSSIAGDGINNAVFRKNEKSFNSEESSLLIEIVRTESDSFLLKYNTCFMQLSKSL